MAFSKPKAHERAERFAAKGQHDKAAREYQSIVENDPKDVRAWLMLADCLVRTGDRAGAVERYTRVAVYYVEAKETNKALAVYRQVLNLDPQRLDVQSKVAALHLELGNLPDAIALYERIAHAQLQAGRVADALHTYKIVADADPSAFARRLRLAELYSREKRTAEAVEAFRLAGNELITAGRLADYVRVAERLLYHDEKDLRTIRKLAGVYLQLGDPRRALMKLNGLLRANPKDEEGIELLAETFMALGKPDKALSALEELARALREKGPAAKADTIRILRRGLEWRPAHAEFREALAELEGRRRGAVPVAEAEPAEPNDTHEIDLDAIEEGDLVELDDDDLVVEEPEAAASGVGSVAAVAETRTAIELPDTASPAPGTRRTVELEAVPSVQSSLTQSVLAEAETVGTDVEALTDFDKILFEAKVYIKYRLFEHALDHVQTALQQQPEHVGALSLRARALTELGRSSEAADAHVRVAQLVLASDPKLAREHLSAARALVPGHAVAQALAGQLEGRAAAPRPRAVVEDDGDSGAFDVVSDDVDEPSVDVGTDDADESDDSDRIGIDLRGEPAANLVDAHEQGAAGADGESTQPFQPIDLSKLGDEDQDEAELEDDGTPAQTGMTLTPFAEAASSRRGPVLERLDADDDLELPALEDDAFDHDQPSRPGLPTQAIEIDPEHTEAVLPGEHDGSDEPEQPTSPLGLVEPEPEPDDDDEDDFELDMGFDADLAPAEPEPPREPEPTAIAAPAAAAPSGGDWPDISDDLAEIRFYVDQGLDDDAEAALDDLEEKYPGHPAIRAMRRGGGGVVEEPAALLVESLAAKPLVDVDEEPAAPLHFDEDEDEDDYLSAIFAEPSASTKTGAYPTVGGSGANLAEGQSVDAATAFDLGVAYREMGLVDAAIGQFETAARDPHWRARALVMRGTLRVHQGDTEAAIHDLQEAAQVARNADEASEAAYELGVLYEMLGDIELAVQQLRTVTPGYRDRDDRLAELDG